MQHRPLHILGTQRNWVCDWHTELGRVGDGDGGSTELNTVPLQWLETQFSNMWKGDFLCMKQTKGNIFLMNFLILTLFWLHSFAGDFEVCSMYVEMEALLYISIQGIKQSRLGFICKWVSGARECYLSMALLSAGFWGWGVEMWAEVSYGL